MPEPKETKARIRIEPLEERIAPAITTIHVNGGGNTPNGNANGVPTVAVNPPATPRPGRTELPIPPKRGEGVGAPGGARRTRPLSSDAPPGARLPPGRGGPRPGPARRATPGRLRAGPRWWPGCLSPSHREGGLSWNSAT